MAAATKPPFGGAFERRFTRFVGIYYDTFRVNSAWIRETAAVKLPPVDDVEVVVVYGEVVAHPQARGLEEGFPTLTVAADGAPATRAGGKPGPFSLTVPLDPARRGTGSTLTFTLEGNTLTNALAWLGRVLPLAFLQRYRAQNRNRQVRILSIESASGERLYDFSNRESPYCTAFSRQHAHPGMNIVGFLTADLGIGESARCMVRAADAAGVPSALVPLKLHCKNRLGDQTYAARLSDANPHPVNVIHVDPPVVRDIDHHHGRGFREGKVNVGYFAWELPEFPDAWTSSFDYLDEIWCPSDFVREAIAIKAPFPVLTMPHAIGFERPSGDTRALRSRFGLPQDAFLFLSLFDLNSYAERKNPRGAIAAFSRSGLATQGCQLVVKVHNAAGNPKEFEALRAWARETPGIVILNETLSRADVYGLQASCDAFISLHRSEGFGFAVAECMYLGKPVIATDWSATREFVTEENGYPVRAQVVELTENHGPYFKGSVWADPDLDDAAACLQRCAGNRAESARLAARGQATIEERFSPAVIGARYQKRLQALAGF
jgi:glycosyltransferase involved in cell wall biosynthesis